MDLDEKIARQIFDDLYSGQWDQINPRFKQRLLDLAEALIDLVLENSTINESDE